MQRVAKSRPRVFYGWWIILGGILGMAIGTGFNFHGLNAFVIPLSSDFGVSLPVVAAGISIARIESAFIGPLEGYLVDRFGPRTMMFIGVPVMGAGFLVASVTPNFPAFIAAFFLGVVLGSSLGFGNPISTAVANWWQRRRGRAFGILWLGTSFASMMVPAINWLVENLGWRSAFRVMGLTVFVLGLPIAALMRHRPEQYGMLPDGDAPSISSVVASGGAGESQGVESTVAPVQPAAEFTIWEALRTSTFWYFVISISIRTGITTGVAINTFPLVVEYLGGSPAQASFLFLLQGVCSAPGRVFLSWAGDAINKRYIMGASLAVMSIVLLLLSQATSITQVTILWVPYAIVWGGLSSLPQSLRADLFGRSNFATIQGTMSPIQNVFSVASPIFAAGVFERTGSYRVPFLVFAGMALMAMVFIFMAKPPKKRVAHP